VLDLFGFATDNVFGVFDICLEVVWYMLEPIDIGAQRTVHGVLCATK